MQSPRLMEDEAFSLQSEDNGDFSSFFMKMEREFGLN